MIFFMHKTRGEEFMEIEDLDAVAKRIFERCMPAKEEIEKSPEKTKFLEAFPSLEYSTIGHILYETIKIALIAGAADIVINRIRHRKEELEESKEKMERAAFEVLKKQIPDEKEAKRIAIEISIIGTEEIELYAHVKLST